MVENVEGAGADGDVRQFCPEGREERGKKKKL